MRVAPDSGSAEALEGERKTVTALFADIKGSTELEQDLDPEEARAIIDPALKLMIDAVRRYDGYIVQSTGDGIFALFGAPVAHEDHPQRGLYAALRMQEELKRYSARLREAGNLPIEARVGVNTGEVVVRSIATGDGHTEYTPIGHTTNLASRMQALAPTGSIAISEQTRKLVEGYFALKPLGPTKIKGVSEPVNVYEVTGLGPLRTRLQRSAGGGLTKFVGRAREMDAMRAAADRAKSGRGQIVAAMAEAGTGKSRLFFEFKAKNQSGWMALETFSVSHGKASAYLPVIDLLHGYFEISAGDDERKRREKVTGRVLALDRSLEDTLPYLFALLAIVEGVDPLAQMDGQVKKRRTLEAIKRILLRETLNQPLMVIFEDLHWIDDETQGFLNLLADSIGTAKILLLVNYRPEYSHQWNSKTYYTQLRLDPLGKESADEMLSALLFQSPLPPGEGQGEGAELSALKRLIIDRTEGNPFFMEETVQVLLDEGALVREGSSVRLTRPLAELKIPPTVQGILAARIDRLPSDAKDLLQTLAVIGREFPLSLIRAVIAKADDELNRLLNDLQLSEFIYEQPAVGDTEYIFKHALTQEVAYNSVLIERRRVLHERTGAAIERVLASHIDDYVIELAHHYRRSADSAKAIEYLLLAAEQEITRNAAREAAAGLRDGLTLLTGITDEAERARREAALQLALGGALAVAGPAASAVEAPYLRARELCERIGDRDGLFAAFRGLSLAYTLRAELGRALELNEQLLSKIARDGELNEMLSAKASTMQALYFLGQFTAARAQMEQIREMSAADPSAWTRVSTATARTQGDRVLALLGYPDQALRNARAALAHARETRIPLDILMFEWLSAHLCYFIRDVRGVREHGGAVFRLANERGNMALSGYAASCLGWAEAMDGGHADGLAEILRGRAVSAEAGNRIRTLQDAQLIECHLRRGDLEAGLAAAADALSHADSTGERFCASELNRLRGELLLAQEPTRQSEAESAFRTAIEVARGQSARWWELRATTRLARMLAKQGKRDEARAMLAEIYNWFTEGFDTADLIDAKVILDQLRG
ncbi:MAG TPA: adenylate/guanylate cyclase domain-containing protein [Candidatus Binataceae bacterium]|nr:adenylate/guanylate cyclase domain-containing protein [Candidatus Binataceae bacterium]